MIMKKLSFLSLACILMLTMSAFSFCSNANPVKADLDIENSGLDTRVKAKPVAEKKKVKVTNHSDKAPLAKGIIEKDGLTWYTDLQLAHEQSQKTGKPVLGFFTGSDWCGWCFKLHDNVLVKEEFIKWADENVVLMEIDFPRRTAIDPELKAQNDNLQRVFSVSGFPTCLLYTSDAADE